LIELNLEEIFAMMKQFCVPALLVMLVMSTQGCATTSQITSNDSNMCMNVINHGSPQPGEPVIVQVCDPWQNQQWAFNGNGPIIGIGGFCLDVKGSAATDGAVVIYTPCSGSPSQYWSANNGAIVGIGGKCLDIGGGDPVRRAPLVINACNGSPSQRWVSH
jgi:hypothetical protein